MNSTLQSPFPEQIRVIAVTAPAGQPDAEKLQKELNFIGSYVKIKSYLAVPKSTTPSYLAGEIPERLQMLNNAINDPEVDMILCARGGFGSMHLLSGIDYDTLRQRNLPLMGYSDITALHCAMLAKNAGIPIAGSNLIGWQAVTEDKFSLQAHQAALGINSRAVLDSAPQKIRALLPERLTTVTAPAYAANLTVLAALCGTEFMPDFRKYTLILEDVNEPLYKIDRMLTQLHLAGVFKNMQALAMGCFTGLDNTAGLQELFCRIARLNDIPLFAGFQFGHTMPMGAINARKNLTLSDGQFPVVS